MVDTMAAQLPRSMLETDNGVVFIGKEAFCLENKAWRGKGTSPAQISFEREVWHCRDYFTAHKS